MKLTIVREMDKKRIGTKITFSGYGNDLIDGALEKELFQQFDFPTVELGGKFGSLESGTSFQLQKEQKKVDEAFSFHYALNIEKVEGITTAEKIEKAIAMCIVVEEEILHRIELEVKSMHLLLDSLDIVNFTRTYEKEVTI